MRCAGSAVMLSVISSFTSPFLSLHKHACTCPKIFAGVQADDLMSEAREEFAKSSGGSQHMSMFA